MTMSSVLHLPFAHRRRAAATPRVDRAAARRRRMVARAYETLLRDVEEDDFWLSARVPVRRDEVTAARTDIEALIARLREGRPVPADALELAKELVRDSGGPLYCSAEPRTVRRRVRVIIDAMG
jgi:hypothetical protein